MTLKNRGITAELLPSVKMWYQGGNRLLFRFAVMFGMNLANSLPYGFVREEFMSFEIT